jgi:hypothetical protein
MNVRTRRLRDRGVARVRHLALLALLAVIVVASHVAMAQIQPPTTIEVNGHGSVTLLANGNALVTEDIKFSAEAYKAFKEAYNPISTFIRELEPRSSPTQIENLSASLDDANNRFRASYILLGFATYKGGGTWEAHIAEPGEHVSLTSKSGDTLVFTNIYAAGTDYRIVETITVKLPRGASNPVYHEDEGVLTYTLNPQEGGNGGALKVAGSGIAAVGAIIAAAGFILPRRQEAGVTPQSTA